MTLPKGIISIFTSLLRRVWICRGAYAWRFCSVVAQGEYLSLLAGEVDHEVNICISKSVDASTMIDTAVYVVDADDVGAQRFQKACVEFTLRWIS